MNRKFLLRASVFTLLWLLTGIVGSLFAQERINIATWKFPNAAEVDWTIPSCVSDQIQLSDCELTSNGFVIGTANGNPNNSICPDVDNISIGAAVNATATSLTDEMSLIFKINTTPFVNIGLSYDVKAYKYLNNAGFQDLTWEYSVDNGSNWTALEDANVTNYDVTSQAYATMTADLSAVAALNGKTAVLIRLTVSNPSAVGAQTRIDNVVFSGSPATCLPPQISSFSATNIGFDGATISWTDASTAPSVATAYKYFNKPVCNTSSEMGAVSIDDATAQFVRTGLEPGTTYYVAVKAICGENSSIWSTECFSYTTCAKPSNLQATYNNGSINITWTDNVNTAWKVIAVQDGTAPDWESATIVNSTSHSVSDLALSTTYNIYIYDHIVPTATVQQLSKPQRLLLARR